MLSISVLDKCLFLFYLFKETACMVCVCSWSHADNCPCGFRHPWQFWHSNFVNPSSNFDTWLRCKCLLVVVSCFRWPFRTVFYNVLCISFATSGWRAKVVFLFRLHCRLTCVSCHDLPQLLGQVATVWQIASPNKTHHVSCKFNDHASRKLQVQWTLIPPTPPHPIIT